MKKAILVLLILSLGKIVFAADFSLSAGAGGLLGYNFTRYTIEGDGVKSTQDMDRFNFGLFAFFDVTYGVLAVTYQRGDSIYAENMILGDSSGFSDGKGRGYERSIGISLMGKYPFKINDSFSWFPMLGVEYQISLLQRRKSDDGDIVYDRTNGRTPEDMDKDGKPYPLSAWNACWINVGAGLDYNIAKPIFLRSELLFSFRLPTTYELSALEVVKSQINVPSFKLAGLTGGPTLKLAAGYRFYSKAK